MGSIEIAVAVYVGCVVFCATVPYLWCCYEFFPTYWCTKQKKPPFPLRRPLIATEGTGDLELGANQRPVTPVKDNDNYLFESGVVAPDNLYVTL